MITIDQQTFEKYVPAFASAESYTFDRMSPYVDVMLRAVEGREVNTSDDMPETLRSVVERYVCLAAARKAVPQLDLILTANGFGVVSNQNVAPASRERVNALIEQLRIDESEAFDMLLAELLQNDWVPFREIVLLFLWRSFRSFSYIPFRKSCRVQTDSG